MISPPIIDTFLTPLEAETYTPLLEDFILEPFIVTFALETFKPLSTDSIIEFSTLTAEP